MLHLLYILAFTILAFVAVGNLIRSLVTVGMESQRFQPGKNYQGSSPRFQAAPHPELLDNYGNMVNEPLLVMRSLSVQDAREQLDAIYKSSPGNNDEDV
jgi:hypothetical protein